MAGFDVVIIGAGVVGSAVARELSRYQVRVAVLEKELDVACGNSGRNTGMLHAGFTYKPGTLKAECAVEGNQEFDQVAGELQVPFRRTGKVVVGFNDHDRENLLKYKAVGEQNGVRGMRICWGIPTILPKALKGSILFWTKRQENTWAFRFTRLPMTREGFLPMRPLPLTEMCWWGRIPM